MTPVDIIISGLMILASFTKMDPFETVMVRILPCNDLSFAPSAKSGEYSTWPWIKWYSRYAKTMSWDIAAASNVLVFGANLDCI
jgi:hypothetical protein